VNDPADAVKSFATRENDSGERVIRPARLRV
jgi:hypothetical protein